MARLYLSGPVTGIFGRNIEAFWGAEHDLAKAGYYATLPHDLVMPDEPHESAMLLCVNQLTTSVEAGGRTEPFYDGVALLEGWEQSEGARLEKAVAEACGILCKTVDEWIEEAS